MQDIVALRHHLHSIAEVSGQEVETNLFLNDFMMNLKPDVHIKRIGGYGLAVVFKGKQPGPRVMVRADIDALKINELNDIEYRSIHEGVSHKCGHDGHAAVLCGLAHKLSRLRPEKGEVVLLFQPAEETGQGAAEILQDEAFERIKPDYAFAFHNLPGFQKGNIVFSDDCFAAASFGLKIELDGKTAHASQPETGRNPSELLAVLIHELEKKRTMLQQVQPLTTFVITHAVLGDETFGVAPGHAELWLTLRSFADKNLEVMAKQIIKMCQSHANNYLFDFSFTMHEAFAATNNAAHCTALVRDAANDLGLMTQSLASPFRWSEDFGRFATVCPISLFGIGCGEEHPALHNADYDFDDDILETAVELFYGIVTRALNLK